MVYVISFELLADERYLGGLTTRSLTLKGITQLNIIT